MIMLTSIFKLIFDNYSQNVVSKSLTTSNVSSNVSLNSSPVYPLNSSNKTIINNNNDKLCQVFIEKCSKIVSSVNNFSHLNGSTQHTFQNSDTNSNENSNFC